MVTTMRACVSSFTVFVFGTSTSMPDCRMGAVIIKMIRSTSTTSINGTMLISESEVPVSRCTWGILLSLRTVQRFDSCHKLRGKTVHPRGDSSDAVQIVVVRNQGWDCG